MEKNVIKFKHESDGHCCGSRRTNRGWVCEVLREVNPKKCDTYLCPFYKPIGCKDWIRRDRAASVELIPPENYERGRKERCLKD